MGGIISTLWMYWCLFYQYKQLTIYILWATKSHQYQFDGVCFDAVACLWCKNVFRVQKRLATCKYQSIYPNTLYVWIQINYNYFSLLMITHLIWIKIPTTFNKHYILLSKYGVKKSEQNMSKRDLLLNIQKDTNWVTNTHMILFIS